MGGPADCALLDLLHLLPPAHHLRPRRPGHLRGERGNAVEQLLAGALQHLRVLPLRDRGDTFLHRAGGLLLRAPLLGRRLRDLEHHRRHPPPQQRGREIRRRRGRAGVAVHSAPAHRRPLVARRARLPAPAQRAAAEAHPQDPGVGRARHVRTGAAPLAQARRAHLQVPRQDNHGQAVGRGDGVFQRCHGYGVSRAGRSSRPPGAVRVRQVRPKSRADVLPALLLVLQGRLGPHDLASLQHV
mmetsp:Transcript_11597/g.30776  ORF Transcript_11597/g.30776 Transcript_11597/m.30776 type:complete len:242 (-) Transcript_11597:1841-2566(-)